MFFFWLFSAKKAKENSFIISTQSIHVSFFFQNWKLNIPLVPSFLDSAFFCNKHNQLWLILLSLVEKGIYFFLPKNKTSLKNEKLFVTFFLSSVISIILKKLNSMILKENINLPSLFLNLLFDIVFTGWFVAAYKQI